MTSLSEANFTLEIVFSCIFVLFLFFLIFKIPLLHAALFPLQQQNLWLKVSWFADEQATAVGVSDAKSRGWTCTTL